MQLQPMQLGAGGCHSSSLCRSRHSLHRQALLQSSHPSSASSSGAQPCLRSQVSSSAMSPLPPSRSHQPHRQQPQHLQRLLQMSAIPPNSGTRQDPFGGASISGNNGDSGGFDAFSNGSAAMHLPTGGTNGYMPLNGSSNPAFPSGSPVPSLPPSPHSASARPSASTSRTSAQANSNSGSTAALPAGKFPHRWRIVALMASAFVLCNMDKVNMSVAVIPMAKELGWSATDRGLVSSSFFWGYALTQVPAGWISTKIGGARVLMAGVALWSFGTLIAPPLAQNSLLALCASRVLVGLGEGFAPSAATAVLAKTVPATERARAVTMVWGGLDVGSAVGLLLAGPLIRLYGWPSVFYLFAVLGGAWCMLWPLIRPDKLDPIMATLEPPKPPPEEEPFNALSSIDLKGSEAGLMPAPEVSVPWRAFFTSRPVWALTTAHFCFNWGYYTLLAWLPSYFELALGLNVERSSFLTLIPYIAMVCMTPLVGPIADGLVKKGTALTKVRKLCQGIAFVGPAACMILCAMLTPPASLASVGGGAAAAAAAVGAPVALLVLLLSLSFALGAWSRAGLYCNHQDLSPQYASALLGITNTAGALPGVLGVTMAGFLLDKTHSWALALFLPTAACQLFGAAIYTAFASSERQSWS